MMPAAEHPTLLDRLPGVQGRLTAQVALSKVTWFAVGGPAEVLFKPVDLDDLQAFLLAKPGDVPHTLLGVGSNLLVRDGGIPGVVIRLGRAFAEITVNADQTITCGAAALDVNVAELAAQHSLAGLEFLSGIPGTMGGALRMNAGAYRSEIADVLVSAQALDGQGQLHTLMPSDFGFSYRHVDVPEDWVFVSATVQGTPGVEADIRARMTEIQEARQGSQPIRSRTGGSTFANPEGHKAWQLIDAAGCRGLTRGGAQISQQHCNFMINTGAATAQDLEALGEDVRQRVYAQSGVTLRWEIKRIGAFAEGQTVLAAVGEDAHE